MATKRGADCDSGGSGEPPLKKVQFEPVRIGPISTLEEMDIKVLQFQNKKLAQVGFCVACVESTILLMYVCCHAFIYNIKPIRIS